jgi:polyisoprenoid-binding protein YceI
MKTNHFLLAVSLLLPFATTAQVRYSTRTGEVSFFSATPAENIQAVNHKATSVFDVTTGKVEFSLLMKAFEFEKALMQEHFNENYMESNTFPKGTFKGKVTGITPDELAKPGMKEVTIEGDLTMHGVTQHRTFKGMVTIDPAGSMLKVSCDFVVKPEDHKITIPSVVRGQIAEEIQVKVRLDLQKM